jgi:hypothetical protein
MEIGAGRLVGAGRLCHDLPVRGGGPGMRVDYGKVSPDGVTALLALGKYAQDSAFCLDMLAFGREPKK